MTVAASKAIRLIARMEPKDLETFADAPALAALIAEGLRSNAPETVAPRTKALRAKFQGMHYVTA